MASNGGSEEFARVELDTLRSKEYKLKPLYAKRQVLLDTIPDIWASIFPPEHEEFEQYLSGPDLEILASLKSFAVDRYQIKSESEGEPRSLCFTFEFKQNKFFEDTKLVKRFEYQPSDKGAGNLVSKPVSIKWKNKDVDPTRGLLNAAFELYAAEEALKVKMGGKQLDIVDREDLWQYEKLREKLVQIEGEHGYRPSFFNWFGFRGVIFGQTRVAPNGDDHQAESDDEDDSELEDLLAVEIFSAGEEVAIALAEDFWPNVVDYFIRSESDPKDEFDDGESSDEAPELISNPTRTSEEARPQKRQRMD